MRHVSDMGYRQRGAALFVALVMLLLLTLLAVTAAQTSVMQERMAGSFRAQQLAFERAEGIMASGRDQVSDPLTSYDLISDIPVGLASDGGTPWREWLATYPPVEYGSSASPGALELSVRACGGACAQRRGSAVGEDPNRKPRYFVISAQQKDLPASPAEAAAWASVQTIYVY